MTSAESVPGVIGIQCPWSLASVVVSGSAGETTA